MTGELPPYAYDDDLEAFADEDESLRTIVREELQAILPFREKLKATLGQLGATGVMIGRVAQRMVTGRIDVAATAYQVEILGARSLPIASLTAIFAGLIISLQFAFFMARFGVQHTVGKVVVLTLFRELGPVLTALTVGARIGSGIAAELGSMAVTEQIDAVRALGADPLEKLVVPRVLACILVMPALTVLADVAGLIAGAAVVNFEYQIPFGQFFGSALETVSVGDFLSGVIKGAVFGIIISITGCTKGFSTEGGTEGVGRVTTETVAAASVAICLSDFVMTKIFLSF